ncbi:MAG TPA: DUF6677 family protein [Gemmataceae bacterium]|jgi:hypothetical protein|nr:DUF6677 family protein [Gemmataceae bacterium]
MPAVKSATKNQGSPPIPYDYFAGLLGYLIPGLGQIYQGRVAKGLLFLVCIYGLFGYGLYLGQGRNVYISNPTGLPKVTLPVFGQQEDKGLVKALYYRPQYCGQFWTGMVAWPAIWQFSRPAGKQPVSEEGETKGVEIVNLRNFQRQPSEEDVNLLQSKGSKAWDLAWVFTVIAGVLNIMVIYDAVAGPALRFAENVDPLVGRTVSAMNASAGAI